MRLGVLAVIVAAIAGCAERQDGGSVCPALCPEQNVPTLDTVIEGIGVSQTVSSYPGTGTEATLLLAARGDSLDVRSVIRFDSIPSRHRKVSVSTDTTSAPTTYVDSAVLRLRPDTTGMKATKPVTISLYNVDTTAADTSTAALVALFRPDRLIGAATFDTSKLRDTLSIPIDSAFLRARVVGQQRVRIGVQVTSSESVQLHMYSSATDLGPQVAFDPSPDTATHVGSYRPVSIAPSDNEVLRRDLTDFNLIVVGTFPAPVPEAPAQLSLGGLPARRGYIRFDLPQHIVDSGTVVRATLSLTQVPSTRFDSLEAVTLFAHASIASAVITSPEKRALLIGGVADSVTLTPRGSGVIDLELVRVVRRWRNTDPAEQPRVLILRTSSEGSSPVELRFYDVNAASGLRPRLRITYVPRVDFGTP